MSKQRENKWSNYAVRILLNTVSHPFEYAKVLIQIGHEPIPPRPSTTLFGKPALKLPNIFEYVKHIKAVDGFSGCYNGLAPKLCGNLLSAVVTQKFIDHFDQTNEGEEEEDEDDQSDEQKKQKFIRSMRCDVITHTAAIVVSQPFHVITVRMMAQFVGRETKYSGLISSVKEIYHQNGLLGFFNGLVPRLIGDLTALILASCLTFAINHYLIEEKELKVYTSATMSGLFQFLATAVTYPFQVVSNCMAVTDSGLMAGSPNFMPHYRNWVDCWVDLSNNNQLKRGSSVLIRYYVGPSMIVGGKMLPFNSEKAIS